MTAFKKTIHTSLKNADGFTLIELMVVIAIIGILAGIAIMNYNPFKWKTYDTIARSDLRNLADSIVEATLNREDVDYEKGDLVLLTGAGGAVGDQDTSGNPRDPVFILSNGVEALIDGSSNEANNLASVTIDIYHTKGTIDSATASGRKEYHCSIDESTGLVSLP